VIKREKRRSSTVANVKQEKKEEGGEKRRQKRNSLSMARIAQIYVRKEEKKVKSRSKPPWLSATRGEKRKEKSKDGGEKEGKKAKSKVIFNSAPVEFKEKAGDESPNDLRVDFRGRKKKREKKSARFRQPRTTAKRGKKTGETYIQAGRERKRTWVVVQLTPGSSIL